MKSPAGDLLRRRRNWLAAGRVQKLPAGLRSLWLVVTMVLGVIFVWMMVRVYNTIDTVPTGTPFGRR